jgi:HK97 family phage portal protein
VAIPFLSSLARFGRAAYRSVAGGLRAASLGLWDRGGHWFGASTAGPTHRTKAGERVDHDKAMTCSVYWACLTSIAKDIAKVPASAVERLEPRGRRTLYDHPATRLLDEDANPNTSAFTFRETLTGWALGWGNGYAEIQRDGAGSPVALWPIHPSRVVVKVENDVVTYFVRADDVGASSQWTSLPSRDVFHVRGYGDGAEGLSVLKYAAEAIGLALAGQTFAAAFFGNGLSVAMIAALKVPLEAEKLAAYRTSLSSAYAGAEKAGGVLVSNGDADFTRFSVNPDEAQVLESRAFSVGEICRWFGRSPQKIGHTDKAQGWGTLDALQVADTTDCLMPWWIRWEQEARRKLIAPGDRKVRLKHWVQALMRGEPKTRAEVYQMRITSGTMTPNEVRELEDEEPVEEEGADSLFMQGAMVPVSVLAKGPASPPTPPAAPPGGEPTDEPQDETSTVAAPDSPPDSTEAVASDVSVTVAAPTEIPPAGPVASTTSDVWLRPLFDVAAARIVSKECLSVGKRVEKSAPMDPWASEFYAKQRGFVAAEFLPVVTAMARAESGPAHDALATLAAGLWKDASARTAEAFRTPERDLVHGLASLVFDTCRAALAHKEAA